MTHEDAPGDICAICGYARHLHYEGDGCSGFMLDQVKVDAQEAPTRPSLIPPPPFPRRMPLPFDPDSGDTKRPPPPMPTPPLPKKD